MIQPGGATLPNQINLTPFSAIMNGYEVYAFGGNGTKGSTKVTVGTAPAAGTRDDLVLLEAWFELITPSSTIDAYGGKDQGTVTNDLVDSDIKAETSRRTQLKWRIRSVSGVAFASYPNGVNDPVVKAQGGAATPTTLTFSSADGRLFIAGSGSTSDKTTLNTVDGYVYALPLAKVTRRAGVTAIASTDIADLRKRSTFTYSGSGSGLDADKWEGQDIDNVATPMTMGYNQSIGGKMSDGTRKNIGTVSDAIYIGDNGIQAIIQGSDLKFSNGTLYKIWHENNDGAGSGLDADKWDGQHMSDVNADLILRNSKILYGKTTGGVSKGLIYLNSSDMVSVGSNIPLFLQGKGSPSYYDSDTATASTVWTSGNDGSGSGLNSDLWDDQHLSDIVRVGTNEMGFGAGKKTRVLLESTRSVMLGANAYFDGVAWQRYDTSVGSQVLVLDNAGNPEYRTTPAGTGAITWVGYKLWHEGNDGAGSGLAADTLDGLHASFNADASTVASRDANGDVTARKFIGDFTGALTGNASSATKLATARTISLTGDVSGSGSFDGSADLSITIAVADNSHSHTSSNISDATNANTANMVVKRDASGNFSAGTITATLSGNASSASKWATARTITLGGDLTGNVSIDGSANVTLTAAVTDNSHNHTSANISDATNTNIGSTLVKRDTNGGFSAGTIAANLSGNASSATKLMTARTINGVLFDGTANITITDSTSLPLTGGVVTGPLRLDPGGTTPYSLAIGSTGGASAASIDFHSGSTNCSFDTTIVSTGGDGTPGNGTLNISAANLTWNNITLVKTDDSRLSDSRTPKSHSVTHISGGSDALSGTLAVSITGNAATATKLASAVTINGTSFDGSGSITVTANPNNHNLVDTTKHPVSGLTTGHVLMATGATAYAFQALPTSSSSVFGLVKTSTGITNSSGTISVSYGTIAGTACQGNDSRLSDSRTPLAHTHAGTEVTSSVAQATLATTDLGSYTGSGDSGFKTGL
jgi:hypothetical protein